MLYKSYTFRTHYVYIAIRAEASDKVKSLSPLHRRKCRKAFNILSDELYAHLITSAHKLQSKSNNNACNVQQCCSHIYLIMLYS